MADYYPLIARAIAGLDPNAPGESRRALYERARTALIAQLRSVQPPLSESEITRERLSLEEAVRKVESEAAQRAREASRPGGGVVPRAAATLSAAPMRRPPETAALRAPRPVRSARVRPVKPLRARPVRRLAKMNNARRAICAPMRRRPAPRARSRRRFRCRMPARRRPIARSPPRPRQRRAADAAAAAGHARVPRHRRRRRRSRPRRRAGQPCRAENLCQRAVALAGIRPARAEHGKPRRRSRDALFV